MATQKEMQDKIDALEAQLATQPTADPEAAAKVADLEARLAAAESDGVARVAELEAALAAQEAIDAARADVKMVRLKNEAGSIVRVDEQTAKGLTPAAGWTKIK